MYDEKGRVSPVKWIGDIRMPNQSDNDSGTTFNDGSAQTDFRAAFYNSALERIRMNILYVRFSIKNRPLDSPPLTGELLIKSLISSDSIRVSVSLI